MTSLSYVGVEEYYGHTFVCLYICSSVIVDNIFKCLNSN